MQGDGNNRIRGQCCAGLYCEHPTKELSEEHKCLICRKILHVLCGEFVQGTDKDHRCNACLNKKTAARATSAAATTTVAVTARAATARTNAATRTSAGTMTTTTTTATSVGARAMVPRDEPPPCHGDGNIRRRGPCCEGLYCEHPTKELSKTLKCLNCRRVLHTMCGVFVEGSVCDKKCRECVLAEKEVATTMAAIEGALVH